MKKRSADRVDEDVRYRVLRALEGNPAVSQRDLAVELNVSLGLVNFCLRALAEKGQIKVDNFRNAENKLRYAYILTPRGLAEKAALTRRFLQRRIREYEALKAEIATLERDVEPEPDARRAAADSVGEKGSR